MLKKLKQFISRINCERDVMLAWTFNKFYWQPAVVLVTPRHDVYRELTVQPQFVHTPNGPVVSWNYGILQDSSIVKDVKEIVV